MPTIALTPTQKVELTRFKTRFDEAVDNVGLFSSAAREVANEFHVWAKENRVPLDPVTLKRLGEAPATIAVEVATIEEIQAYMGKQQEKIAEQMDAFIQKSPVLHFLTQFMEKIGEAQQTTDSGVFVINLGHECDCPNCKGKRFSGGNVGDTNQSAS